MHHIMIYYYYADEYWLTICTKMKVNINRHEKIMTTNVLCAHFNYEMTLDACYIKYTYILRDLTLTDAFGCSFEDGIETCS